MSRTSERRRVALLVVVGLLLVTNTWWLFPAEGEDRYTYERQRVTVEDGRLEYEGRTGEFYRVNDLVRVGCQPRGDTGDGRACGFDAYLAAHGPVEVETDWSRHDAPAFVRLSDGYYHRVVERDDTGSRAERYDVEPVTPRELLDEVAVVVSESTVGDVVRPDRPYEVAVTGERLETRERFSDDELGEVYRYEGRYYTVVKTAEERIDRPVMSDALRPFLLAAGVFAWLAAVLLALPDVGGGPL